MSKIENDSALADTIIEGANARHSPITATSTTKSFRFKKSLLRELPDVSLYHGNIYQIYKLFGNTDGLDYTSPNGNRIILRDVASVEALKRTSVYLSGKNNKIVLEGLRSVYRLDIACINGSSVSIQSPQTIRGMTVISTHGSRVDVGRGCLISRDVLIYASKAHGLYGSTDGERRYKERVSIKNRVWLGQGARILSGAEVGNGSVIGSYSVLAGKIANNCAAAGNPCRVTTRNIFWTATAVAGNGNYFEMRKRSGKTIPAFVRLTDETL